MNQKSNSKIAQILRSYRRSKKLKAAALTLGLTTAWGVADANAAFLNSTSTVTIHIGDASAFALGGLGQISDTATVTIGLADSLGTVGTNSSLLDVPFDVSPDGTFLFIGVAGNDLVLSFPNGGAGVLGVSWKSLFVDPDPNNAVTEGEILQQLADTDFKTGDQLESSSALGRLLAGYGNSMRTPYGDEATLVAFTNNTAGSNHGESAGTLRQSAVPEPGSLVLALSAGGLILGLRRYA